MKILIIGADGQLGVDLCKVIPLEQQIPLTIADLDITDKEQCLEVVNQYKPEVVINTAGYHNVDACEDNEIPCFTVNTVGVKNLAQACKTIDATLVHISTDYVFDGKKQEPYVESDTPKPLSVYGLSKLAGEYCLQYSLKKHFIVRTTGLYGEAGCLGKGGGNFVENIIKKSAQQKELKVVDDETLCPTYTYDLAQSIFLLIQTKDYGLYHIVNSAGCSWYEFTNEIFKLLKKNVVVSKIKSKDLGLKANRPEYSILTSEKLKTPMRDWKEALKAYLMAKGHLNS